jgi:uncharacterized surface protein with fasciclin (FAS1) repeats
MFRIYKSKVSICLFCGVLLSLAIFNSGCSKGFKDYYDDKNTKGGFLYDKLKSDSSFSTFVKALDRANITQFISEGGLYTVFAPTNEAFSNFLTANGFSSIDAVPLDRLYNILSFHIVYNMWYNYDLRVRFSSTQQTLYLTRNRKFLDVDVRTPGVIKVNTVPVISTLQDIDADNGVIHGIGEVLIPLPNLEEMIVADPDLLNSTYYKMMQVIKDSTFDRFNSFDRDRDGRMDSVFYKTYPSIFGGSTYSTTIEFRQNSVATSQGGDPLFTTFLIPSNAALDAYIAPALARVNNKIDSLSPSYVEAVLESYLIPDSLLTSAKLIARPVQYRTINANFLPATPDNLFVRKDIRASNGYINIINTTFTPPSTSVLNSAIGKIFTDPQFSTFLLAIRKASLEGVWAVTTKTGTFLAPTNEAFAAAGLDVKNSTLNGATLTATQFSNIIRHHLINENLTPANLAGTGTVTKNSDLGAAQPLVFTNGGTTVTSAAGVVATVTLPAVAIGPTNVGYVYKIDKMLMPKP